MNGFIESFNIEKVSGWLNLEKAPFYIVYKDKKIMLVPNRVRADFNGLLNGFDYKPEDIGIEFDGKIPFKLVLIDTEGNHIGNSPCSIETRVSELNKVYHGVDDWLFLDNDTNQSLMYSFGEKKLPSKFYENWLSAHSEFKEYCNSHGATYFQLITPAKEVVYSKYIEGRGVISNDRPIINILKNDNSGFVLYPTYNIDNELYYYKGDTHWNYYGAYEAYKMYLNCLGLKFVSIKEVNTKMNYMKGDLISKLIGKVNVELVCHFNLPGSLEKRTYTNGNATTGRVEEYYNEQGIGSLLVFHSSSIDWMKPFLVKSFKRAKFVWGNKLECELVKEFKPDHVLNQTNERFLTRVPKVFP